MERRATIKQAIALLLLILAGLIQHAVAQVLEFRKGDGVAVCEAYKSHLEKYAELVHFLACGERFLDSNAGPIKAPEWRRLDVKKHKALFEKLKDYEIRLKAEDYSWSKEEISRQVRIAKKAVDSPGTATWLTVIDLDADGTADYIVAVQQGSCFRPRDLGEEEMAAVRSHGIDVAHRTKRHRIGGVIYIVNKRLTDIDRAHHERLFGRGGQPLGLFIFEGKPYADAYTATKKGDYFAGGSFTVMETTGVERPSVCEVKYEPKERAEK